MTEPSYHATRLPLDPRRDVLWKALCDYFFSRLVAPEDCVLDLGCGYCSFINNIRAAKRIALDSWSQFPGFVEQGVEAVVGPLDSLGFLEDHSVDFVFASNVFEHVSQEDFSRCLQALRVKLSDLGWL
jgi:SAM-dependent methyltransferase